MKATAGPAVVKNKINAVSMVIAVQGFGAVQNQSLSKLP
jgi:hypothetical protein